MENFSFLSTRRSIFTSLLLINKIQKFCRKPAISKKLRLYLLNVSALKAHFEFVRTFEISCLGQKGYRILQYTWISSDPG